jgi:hypothetical protein
MAKSISLVIIDTTQHALARNALIHSIKSFKFDQILIFSDKQNQWGNNEIIEINEIKNINEYNKIVTKKIPEFIKTDFCLIIQYDGFIINSDQFSPHFFFYDYIGAPWPHFSSMNVGNGGFSWRSRKLIDAIATLPYEDLFLAEDLFICRQNRPLLEDAHGIIFAPPDIASHFSTESTPVRFPTFGFHGVFHLPQIYRESIDFLIENINLSTAKKWQHILLPEVTKISTTAGEHLAQRLSATN